jgi:hypothetical protein
MEEKKCRIAASHAKKPSVCHGKILVGHEKPPTDTREGHLESHKGRVPITEDKSHEGVCFLSPTLQKHQRTQGIERRGRKHEEEQHHCTSRGTVDISQASVVSSAELLASPMNSQATPKRCRMKATVELPTSLSDDAPYWLFHAALPFSTLPTD